MIPYLTVDAFNKLHPDWKGRYAGIPDMPVFRRISVWRVPTPKEVKTEGGLYVPTTWTQKDKESGRTWREDADPRPLGVLLAAGLGALDIMRDHKVNLGDVVAFATMAGKGKSVDKVSGKDVEMGELLDMNIDDIIGSRGLLKRIADGEVSCEWNADEDEHVMVANGAERLSMKKRHDLPRKA